ncbi:MAG: hypothetical protein LH472_13520 [Pyrinomonadaceae bacterium]|nr:hypothetical protein [Pyrinomonadaceae bacterium]
MRKRHGDKATERRGEKIAASLRPPASGSSECSACGTLATRDFAKFCRVCGKLLLEDYQPLDTLRASYRLQGKSFPIVAEEKTVDLFAENKNSASWTASAFVVYSLVPYLGILFCPGALLMGGIGALAAYRQPHLGGGRTSIYSIVLSVIIFAVQILLWWLLYYIPELGRRII